MGLKIKINDLEFPFYVYNCKIVNKHFTFLYIFYKSLKSYFIKKYF